MAFKRPQNCVDGVIRHRATVRRDPKRVGEAIMKVHFALAAFIGLSLTATSAIARDTTATGQSPQAMTYNWFANASSGTNTKAVPKIVLVGAFGAGTYICTPAGSGKNAQCFKRGS